MVDKLFHNSHMLTGYRRRKSRIRKNVAELNIALKPRIVVFRSNKNIYAQLLSNEGKIITSFSTLSLDKSKKATGMEMAGFVGEAFAQLCIKIGVAEVVFDRGGYFYGGRVKVVAEACRKVGLKF